MGKSDRPIIGYRYKFGEVLALAQNKLSLMALKFQDKDAWKGSASGGETIYLDKPELHGGSDREGGVKGYIDVQDGAEDQIQNGYLAEVLGSTISAMRYVTTLVFRAPFYHGNNPYPKPPQILATDNDIYSRWQSNIGRIYRSRDLENGRVYIAIDNAAATYNSGDMDEIKAGVTEYLESLKGQNVEIYMVAYSDQVDDSIQLDASSDADYDTLIAWVDALTEGADVSGEFPIPTYEGTTIGPNDADYDVVADLDNWYFKPYLWNSTNLAGLTASATQFGDGTINNNDTLTGLLSLFIDVREYNGPFELTYSDALAVTDTSGESFGYIDSLGIYAYTQAQFDAVPGGSKTTLHFRQSVKTNPTGSYPRSQTVTVPASADYIQITVQMPAATSLVGVYTTVLVENPLVTFNGASFTHWDEGVGDAVDFFGGTGRTTTSVADTVFGDLIGVEGTPTNAQDSLDLLYFIAAGNAVSPTDEDAQTLLLDLPDTTTVGIAFNNGDVDGLETYIDNTEGSVSTVDTGSDLASQMVAPQSVSAATWIDMNPIHMFRWLLTRTETHAEINTDLIGDSFATDAQTLYDELFGLSFFFSGKPEDLKKEIERHIDGAMFFDPSTGKFETKLIRDDYVVGSLYTFNKSNVKDWGDDINRDLDAELPNRLVVKYRRQADNSNASVAATNEEDISARAGTYRTVERSYHGIRDATLAAQVAERDLRAISSPRWSGTIKVPYAPLGLNRGSAFILTNSDYGINAIVCRVVEIIRATDKGELTEIQFSEDVFSLGSTIAISTDDLSTAVTYDRAEDATNILLQEIPYYYVSRKLGSDDAEALFIENNDYGMFWGGAKRPDANHVNWIPAQDANVSGDWTTKSPTSFTKGVTSLTALSRDPAEVTITVDSITPLSEIPLTTLALLGGTEWVRIDTVTENGAQWDLTLARGVLDTVPVAHAINEELQFVPVANWTDEQKYVATETMDLRVLTRTADDQQGIWQGANATQLTFDSRAFRPYPPGDFLADGSRDDILGLSTDLALTWAHRNRLTQTTDSPEDYLDADVTPESGQTYEIQLEAFDLDGVSLGVYNTISSISGNSRTLTVAEIETSIPADTAEVYIHLYSSRDSYNSWTAPYIVLRYAYGFGNVGFGYNFGE